MSFTLKKIFFCLVMTSQALFTSTAKKVVSVELDQNDIQEPKITTKNTEKPKRAPILDYEGKQIIFCISKDFIFQNSKQAKEDKEKMSDYFESLQAELFQRHQELQKQQAAFEQKRKTAKPEAMQKEEEELAKKGYEFQRWQMEQQQEIKEREENLMKEFMLSINQAVKEFCEAKGNEKVVIVTADTYIPTKYDASEEITNIMNKRYESEKKAEKAKSKEKETKK